MAEETRDNKAHSTGETLPEETSTQEQYQDENAELDALKAKVEELQKLADLSKDQLLRKAAEFENYKRRSETDFANLVRNANEGLILALLPILNDFIRSLKAGAENKEYDSFYKGVELISTKLTKILEVQGLTPFESVGQPFNVEYHDALLQMPRTDVPPHTVIEEVERGYKLNDKVLRHAKVIVSTAPAESGEGTRNAEEVKA
ncbi:MAG: nucleotide exchange factor GrpE [Ignavibacteriae bacterium]|nr:nucleotide exchange factor GrpE [Ignavibacteriota bacterium]